VSVTPQDAGNLPPYRLWTERGEAALRRGDFGQALEAYERAHGLATDDLQRDRADLNLATCRLQMGDAKGGEEGLREILLRASDAKIAFHAAYDLASSLRKQGRYERALSYAKRAMERARELAAPEYLAPVHNLHGNILLSQMYLDEALEQYRIALDLRRAEAGDTRFSRAIVEENIGYCLLLKKELASGTEWLRGALVLADEVGDRRCRAECLQDLCYGHLLDGAHDEAIDEGRAALEEAQRSGFSDIEENCHYLLGELGTRTGRTEIRDFHFETLERLHPEVPFLREFLCTVDVTDFITLKR
jgi:tetratricopeptide (TPR) repeat protein